MILFFLFLLPILSSFLPILSSFDIISSFSVIRLRISKIIRISWRANILDSTWRCRVRRSKDFIHSRRIPPHIRLPFHYPNNNFRLNFYKGFKTWTDIKIFRIRYWRRTFINLCRRDFIHFPTLFHKWNNLSTKELRRIRRPRRRRPRRRLRQRI